MSPILSLVAQQQHKQQQQQHRHALLRRSQRHLQYTGLAGGELELLTERKLRSVHIQSCKDCNGNCCITCILEVLRIIEHAKVKPTSPRLGLALFPIFK